MIQIDGLHTHYGLSHIIQGVTLTAAPGEVVGIFGRNGVGKTTLLKAVAGWVRPTSGAITFAGTAVGGLAPDQIARRGIGFVPEDRRIFPGLSVQENLELGLLQKRGRRRAEEAAAMEEIYERFPRLRERRRQLGTTLSGGEQQMLAIGRVLVGSPSAMLIDEPSEGLAPMIVAEIFAIVRDLKEKGVAVLLVEQNLHEALAVCDRFYVIDRGRVVLEGDAEAEHDRQKLVEAIAV
ncbi:MAG TPA: ABC transporter ATP-binding protein [Pararhizobium sp.]|jgi:branched-chain amino acid transport system ATP-binding protein|nr:ABC transporter ATP-binding protein [Pararhizobium sp.]